MPSQIMPTVNLLKLPDPAARTAKYVNMMNATKQQEAAERQAQIAQKTLDLKTKEDVREEALQVPRLTKLEQENAIQALTMFRDAVGDIDENDLAAKEAVRADLVSRVKGYGQFLPPASQWTRATIERLMMDSAKEIDKLYATPIASVSVNDRTGQTTSITAGGLDPRAEVIGEVAPRTPMAPAPQARPQAAPRTPTAEAPNPFAPDYKPNSAAAPVNSLSLVVDSALETGVMAKADFDKLVSIAQPGSGPKLEAWARQHNITIAPNAPGVTDNQVRGAPANLPDQMAVSPMSYDGKTPQSQFADMRGPAPRASFANLDGGQPPMQNVMAQAQGRTPFIARRESPAPAEVSPDRLRAEADAKRQTPAQAAAITAAIENTKVGIQRDARLAEETRTKTRGRKLFSAALDDMRKDYATLNKLRAIPSTGRPALDNFGDFLSSSYLGRKAQSAVGTKASVALNNIANSRLTLLNALKEVTNMSAAQLSSNVELMTFLDSLADPTQGYESAVETIRRLENLYGAPTAAQGKRRTPVVASGWGKVEVEPN